MSSPQSQHRSSPVQGVGSSAAPADITTWFLNAKRSLSSISLCSRAHVLVDSARVALQEASIISARCSFLRKALHDQLAIARQVNRGMHSTQEAFKLEFEKTLLDLDNADIGLNNTLELLRNSLVDPAFAVQSAATSNGDSGEQDGSEEPRIRTLHDFVEDEGIENLKSKLRHSIDNVQESHDAIQTALASFDADLAALGSSLSSIPDLSTPNQPLKEPLQPHLHALEENTEAMASLLESLTQHFDRCSAALKASETASQDPSGSHMSASETAELHAILARDASEVDDVVGEIKERLADMESTTSYIQRRIDELQAVQMSLTGVFGMLEEFAENLTAYLDGYRGFELRQEELRQEMGDRLEELLQLGEFYDSFVQAYDALVVEVGRRKGVAARMEAVLKEASRKLQVLYDEDMTEREAFRAAHGQWLPVDIWRGVNDPPIRYSMERDLQGGLELPPLEKEVIERALRKRQERGVGGGV